MGFKIVERERDSLFAKVVQGLVGTASRSLQKAAPRRSTPAALRPQPCARNPCAVHPHLRTLNASRAGLDLVGGILRFRRMGVAPRAFVLVCSSLQQACAQD